MLILDGKCEACEPVHAFLMMGQSNMAGRGDFGQVPEIHNPLCNMLRMGRWQEMSEPINPDRQILHPTFHSGIGLAASFAEEYAKATEKPVGLIPCADGGTKLCQWMPGEILFDHAVMQAKLAMRSSVMCGILWHQGESDCCSDTDWETYATRLIDMFQALRKQLDAPGLPIILGEVSEAIEPKSQFADGPERLNELLLTIPQRLANCAVASSAGLALKPDKLHFCSASCRIFGRRYFEAYRHLTEDNQGGNR